MDLLIDDKKTVLGSLKSSCFVSFSGFLFFFFLFSFFESEKKPLERWQIAVLQSKKKFDALLIPSSKFSTSEMKSSLALLSPECFYTGIITSFPPL